MSDWLHAFAKRLAGQLEDEAAALAPQRGERNDILELARLVAHGTERKNAPLATFVLGRYVTRRQAQGVDPTTALTEGLDVARRLLPEETSE